MRITVSLLMSLLLVTPALSQQYIATIPAQQSSGGLLSRFLNRNSTPTQAVINVPQHQGVVHTNAVTMQDVVQYNYYMQHLMAMQSIANNTENINQGINTLNSVLQERFSELTEEVQERHPVQTIPQLIQPLPQVFSPAPQIPQQQSVTLTQPQPQQMQWRSTCPNGQCPTPTPYNSNVVKARPLKSL